LFGALCNILTQKKKIGEFAMSFLHRIGSPSLGVIASFLRLLHCARNFDFGFESKRGRLLRDWTIRPSDNGTIRLLRSPIVSSLRNTHPRPLPRGVQGRTPNLRINSQAKSLKSTTSGLNGIISRLGDDLSFSA